MGTSLRRAVCAAAAIAITAPALAQDQPPVFRAGVEVTTIDATVLDRKGQPVTDLGPGEFTVKLDGKPRRVVTAEWVRLKSDAAPSPPTPVPEGYSTNEGSTAGRLFVLVVDEPNIRFGASRAIVKAASDFVDRLEPSDRVAVIGFGDGSPATPFLADRDRIRAALNGMHGQMEASDVGRAAIYHVALPEALAMEAGDTSTQRAVILRECANQPPADLDFCAGMVLNIAKSVALEAEHEGDETRRGLAEVLTALGQIDAPKTLILVTEGFISSEGIRSPADQLGDLAAAARTSIYVLKLDDNFFDITQSDLPIARGEDTRQRLDTVLALAAASRGTVFQLAGSADRPFERIETETSGYYLIGVESEPSDRDGRPHHLAVGVSRPDVDVRSRRTLLDRSALAIPEPRTLHDEAVAALESPLLAQGLPLRVATFSLQGPDPGRVQMLIHADIGGDYTTGRPVAVAYVVTDLQGHQVQANSLTTRVGPLMPGLPSPLQFSGGASLAPGRYRLKLSVAEGKLVGSVEHEFSAGLVDGGVADLSDLMVGGPATLAERIQPTITPDADFGALQGYLEAYGRQSSALRVRYEVARSDDGPAILGSDAPGETAGDARTIFTQVMSIGQLPPGAYRLRAVVSDGGEQVASVTRGFAVAPRPVLASSADDVVAADRRIFLPVSDTAFQPAFERDEALAPDTLETFRALVAPGVRDAFDAGVAQLRSGHYIQAEDGFKRAIRPDVDSTPALTYLAATFAASGHDAEASSAWQTALIDGEGAHDIYRWLGEALLRSHQLNEARSILGEAVQQWPSDPRFTRPLAMIYATFGQGVEAVRMLERYLDQRPDDPDALFYGLEWLYDLHSDGAVAHSAADDLGLARTWATAYARTKGPQAPLVRQWLDFLEQH